MFLALRKTIDKKIKINKRNFTWTLSRYDDTTNSNTMIVYLYQKTCVAKMRNHKSVWTFSLQSHLLCCCPPCLCLVKHQLQKTMSMEPVDKRRWKLWTQAGPRVTRRRTVGRLTPHLLTKSRWTLHRQDVTAVARLAPSWDAKPAPPKTTRRWSRSPLEPRVNHQSAPRRTGDCPAEQTGPRDRWRWCVSSVFQSSEC